MKLSFIFVLVLCINVSAKVYSQENKVTLDLTNVSMEEFITEIKGQTGLNFLYNSSLLRSYKSLNVKVSEEPLNKVLNEVFKDKQLYYEYVKGVIVIKKANKLFTEQKVFKTITGIVKDSKGQPLPGVSVVIKGTNTGSATDIDGKFQIKTEKKKGLTLVFSFIGMKTKEVAVGIKTVLSVVLEDDSEQLQEVVVNGYSKIAKERSTGSFSVIDSKALKTQVTTNIVDKFEGLSTGLLTTTENGNGGNKTSLIIRGQGTFSGDKEPLIVVDGFVFEGSLDDINPNDIDNINILQDAAAASIWGVKAANGVIVITTKKGKKGKVEVEYNGLFSIESKPDLDYLQIASSNAIVDAQLKIIKSGLDKDYNAYMSSESMRSKVLNAVQQAYADKEILPNYDDTYNALINKYRNTDSFNEIQDALLQNSFSQQHNISIRGGGEKNSFFISTNYSKDESVEKGDIDERITLLINNQVDLTSKLHLNLSGNIAFNKSDANATGLGLITGFGGSGQVARFQSLYNEDGSFARLPNGINDRTKKEYEAKGFKDWGYNPLHEAELNDFTTKNNSIRFNAALSYDILDCLGVTVKGQYQSNNTDSKNLINADSYEARHNINFFTMEEEHWGETSLTYQFPEGAILDHMQGKTSAYTLRSQLDFDKIFADRHHITVVGGIEFRQSVNESNFKRYLGYNDSYLSYKKTINWEDLAKHVEIYDGSKVPTGITDNSYIRYTKSRFASTFLNTAYTLDNKYTASISGKIDQTNMFGVDARLKKNPLWSVGLGWNISNEDFFNSEKINKLKLRFSYGINGNIHSNATTETTLKVGMDFQRWEDTYRFNSYGNPSLTYEDTKQGNIALEFGMFNFRLKGTVEYYWKNSENLLSQFEVNPTYGFKTQYKNLGKINNRGIDLNLQGVILDKKDFQWNSILNFSYNTNEVMKYENTTDNASSLVTQLGNPGSFNAYTEGESVGTIYAYRWAGLNDNGMPQVYDREGNIIGLETEITDMADLKNAGQVIPPVYGGFINNFTYKNLTLSVMMSYKFGHIFRRPTYNFYKGESHLRMSLHEDVAKMWTPENTNTNIPGLPVEDLFRVERNNYRKFHMFSDEFVEDASHIRLRQVSLSYNLNAKALKKLRLPFQSVDFVVQARNLGLLWKANDYDIDPDAIPLSGGAGSVDGETMIISRPGFKPSPNYSLGVNIRF